MNKRVFVLGSCVSRDALELVSAEFEIVAYIARTSMASIGVPPVCEAPVRGLADRLPSAFQRKMLLNDLNKSTLSAITETEHDLLLLDFIDERFDLVCCDDTMFSLTGELQHAGLEVEDSELILAGSDIFFSHWTAGFERFLDKVEHPERIVLNKAYWAEYFPDGTVVSSQQWIRKSNLFLQKLYDIVDARISLATICYPGNLVLADPAHKWGKAPYHYAQCFYEHTVGSLRAIALRND
ncbi:DUF6270 domain-containing protein [uncultured Stenotrophomonas sp.]|uniref:DUF6270 domain-containing protein n=1 Tax=uncultured Stenotrophomonas sp. TaxID=165438 RepID=UPI0025D817D0|nr:DUF6270 domain-containing protein [uncultured Stenotrophomonas sp.]